MASPNLHWLLLSIVILAQLLFLFWCFRIGHQIAKIMPTSNYVYKLKNLNGVFYIDFYEPTTSIKFILSDVNIYLENHYENGKSPDISQISQMVKEKAQIHDRVGSFIATVPILIGLAGTVLGLFFAFSKFQSNNSSDFLSLLSKSSSIAFIGTLSGIVCTVISNFFINYSKQQRDIGMNSFFSFLNSNLSPKLPTIKDETIKLIAGSMQEFSAQYFKQFELFTIKFEKINAEISRLYENGFRGIIEKNSISLEKLSLYIEKLDSLHTITKDIVFKPTMVNEFSESASKLVDRLVVSSKEHADISSELKEILNAYQQLEKSVGDGIVNLSADKQVFANYGLAIKQFLDTSEKKLHSFSEINARYASEIEKISYDFLHSAGKSKDEYINAVELTQKKLIKQIDDNINSDGYKDYARQIELMKNSIEEEHINILQLSNTLSELNNKITDVLMPALVKTSESANSTNSFLRSELPRAMKETIEVNRQIVISTSEKLFGEPKSWGQWTFKLAKELFKRKRKNNGRQQ